MSVYRFARARPRGGRRPSPVFLAFVALAVLGGVLAWTQTGPGSRLGDFGVFCMVIGGWIVSLCLHEFGHAYAALRAGDHSVEAAGYLTLNPLRYAHPILSLVLPLLFIIQGGIGLPGGAVYLHKHAFRSRAAHSAAAAAGPASNVVFAVVLLLIARSHTGGEHARFWAGLAFLGLLQITAVVLNLLPVPGLDGYAIIEPYLDPETVRIGEKVKPWGLIGVILLLQIDRLNAWFFDLVYWLYDASGAARFVAQLGWSMFQFWTKQPV